MRNVFTAVVSLCALIGLVLLDSCSMESIPDSKGAMQGSPFPNDDWQHILVDDQRSKWGDFDEPIDVVVTQERPPGEEPDASLYWFRQPEDASEARTPVCWRQLSNKAGAFARAGVGSQSSALVFDVDKDGRDDFVIAGWDEDTSMVWFRSKADRPERNLIDNRQSHIEAGGAAFDIDRDGDLDGDGNDDLIGGGRSFKHIKDKEFEARTVDPDYGFSRSAAADFVEGGHPEILLGSGDGQGPLNLYEWRDDAWERSTLIANLDHRHTLQTGDINGDGHLDIYTAEMHTPGSGSTCRQVVLYGDGRGGFNKQVV